MHCGRLADPLDPITEDLSRLTSKRMKTEADHEEIGKVEWFGSLWLHDGTPCIPAEALMATFVAAAKTRNGPPSESRPRRGGACPAALRRFKENGRAVEEQKLPPPCGSQRARFADDANAPCL